MIKMSQKYSLHFSGYLVEQIIKPVTKLKGEEDGK